MHAQYVRPDDLVSDGGLLFRVLRVQRQRGLVRLWLFARPQFLRAVVLRFDQDLPHCRRPGRGPIDP